MTRILVERETEAQKLIWKAVEQAACIERMSGHEFMREVRSAWKEAMERRTEMDLEAMEDPC